MKITIATAVISLCGLCIAAHAANLKIGFVSPEIILKESRVAKIYSKKINDEFAPRSAVITGQSETIKQKSLALERDAPTLNDQQRLAQKKEIADLDHVIQNEQRSFQSDFAAQKRAELQNVLDLLNKVVMRIAKDENYDFILQNAAYASPAINLTKRVIMEMDNETTQ